jgi:hypothetical protein
MSLDWWKARFIIIGTDSTINDPAVYTMPPEWSELDNVLNKYVNHYYKDSKLVRQSFEGRRQQPTAQADDLQS